MRTKMWPVAFGVLALTALACSFTINVPDFRRVATIPTVTEPLRVPALADPQAIADLRLEFGAGELTIQPGAEGPMVDGTARYNVRDLKPEVAITDDRVQITNGNFEFSGIPSFNNYINAWDLRLGDEPLRLRITAGAYRARMELGGVPLHELRITDGAADVELSFSEPNPVAMETLRYETGASTVSLKGLANANVESLFFRSGAGDYTLDFSGELLRDATVEIESGLSSLEIVVPEGVDARVSFQGALSNVNARGGWRQSGGDYFNDGTGPSLRFTINMGAGNVTLSNR